MRFRRITILLLVFVLLFSFGVSSFAQEYDPNFEQRSKAIYLYNLDTDTVLYQKNAETKLPPASITKVMTYIVAYENTDDVMNSTYVIPQEVDDYLTGTGSSMSGIRTGEELTIFELLNLMMVPSGNDASLALSFYISEKTGRDFSELMNEKAKQLGCFNTNFVNPHGLHDENHYSTARDIAVITKYAMTLPYFMDITNQLYYTLRSTNKSQEERTVYATNRMLSQHTDEGKYYYRYVKGIKTGSHDEAGYCLVSSASKEGYSYICVALGAPYEDEHGEMLDSRELYEWAFDNFAIKTVLKEGDIKGEIKVDYAWDKDTILLSAGENVSALLPSNIETSSILYKYNLPESISAPIEKGEKMGTVTLSYADRTIATIDLLASESIEKSNLLYFVSVCRKIFFANFITTVIFFVVLILLIYFLIVLIYNINRNRQKKHRHYAGSKNYKYKK